MPLVTLLFTAGALLGVLAIIWTLRTALAT
jgi:hypothetical protein